MSTITDKTRRIIALTQNNDRDWASRMVDIQRLAFEIESMVGPASRAPLDRLKHHVTGAIQRGEREPITAVEAKHEPIHNPDQYAPDVRARMLRYVEAFEAANERPLHFMSHSNGYYYVQSRSPGAPVAYRAADIDRMTLALEARAKDDGASFDPSQYTVRELERHAKDVCNSPAVRRKAREHLDGLNAQRQR